MAVVRVVMAQHKKSCEIFARAGVDGLGKPVVTHRCKVAAVPDIELVITAAVDLGYSVVLAPDVGALLPHLAFCQCELCSGVG
jgi:hypothetical protein